jgi:tetratricopeptide (TPR) repeat protein
MERDYTLGKGIYLLLKRVNSFSHCIDYYDYLYFKAGEFDQRRGKESWEKMLYQAVLYKNNSYFKQSFEILRAIRHYKKDLVDLELADLARKVPISKLPIPEKIDLLRDIALYDHDPDLKIYLACFYMKEKTHHNSISLLQDTLPAVRNKFILSDLYNLLGDIYGELKEVSLSRHYYTKSLHTYDRVKSGNFHAYKGLSGW